jgi:hypothetical protein
MEKSKSSETGYLSNMLGFPANKEERVLAHILETKFHTDSVIDLRLEVRMNPTIKDLVINRPAAKKKRSVGIGSYPGFTARAHQQALTTGPFGNTCEADAVSPEVAKRGVEGQRCL